jgi:hypothetical protein
MRWGATVGYTNVCARNSSRIKPCFNAAPSHLPLRRSKPVHALSVQHQRQQRRLRGGRERESQGARGRGARESRSAVPAAPGAGRARAGAARWSRAVPFPNVSKPPRTPAMCGPPCPPSPLVLLQLKAGLHVRGRRQPRLPRVRRGLVRQRGDAGREEHHVR